MSIGTGSGGVARDAVLDEELEEGYDFCRFVEAGSVKTVAWGKVSRDMVVSRERLLDFFTLLRLLT